MIFKNITKVGVAMLLSAGFYTANAQIILPSNIKTTTEGTIILNGTITDACNDNNKSLTISLSGTMLNRISNPVCNASPNFYRWYYDNNTSQTGDDVILNQFENATLLSLSGTDLLEGGYYVDVTICRAFVFGGGTPDMAFTTSSTSNTYTFIPNISITSNLTNKNICEGATVGLNLSITGTIPQYSWNTGATTAGINANLGAYVVTVSGLCNSVVSDQVNVILATTTIVSQPVSRTICTNNLAIFTVSAIGLNLSYAWSNGLSTVSSMMTSTLGSNYNVTVSGTCGTVISSLVGLSINPSTQITRSPITQTVCRGSSALFAVSTSGQNLSYTWSNGAANAALMSTSVAGSYTVTVSGTCGQVVASPFALVASVCSAPIVSVVIIFPSTVPSTFTGTSANISWPTLTGAATYCIRYSKTANFSTTTKTVCGLNASNYLFVLSLAGLRVSEIDETIYYQVAGVDADGNMSQWSDTQSFSLRTDEITSLENKNIAPKFSIYPNPTSWSFTIKNAPIGSKVEVFNMLGVLIYTQTITSLETIISENFVSGIYFVKVGSQIVKLIVE